VKRQDAINLITKTIYDNSMRSSYMETMPVANKVLTAMEEAGLITPPKILVEKRVYDIDTGRLLDNVQSLSSEWDVSE
jgi:hypothetical protein